MSGATQTIDVLVTIDADYLIAHPGDVGGAVAMLVSRDAVDKQASGNTGEGGDELWIDVNPATTSAGAQRPCRATSTASH
ncbi:hypothetical protein [Pseudomonas rhizophila]|uniref:hypothetical protein n=1 Tax=Pseudomonas rhizophila TaxID=2045200 RepID=UPI0030DBF644